MKLTTKDINRLGLEVISTSDGKFFINGKQYTKHFNQYDFKGESPEYLSLTPKQRVEDMDLFKELNEMKKLDAKDIKAEQILDDNYNTADDEENEPAGDPNKDYWKEEFPQT